MANNTTQDGSGSAPVAAPLIRIVWQFPEEDHDAIDKDIAEAVRQNPACTHVDTVRMKYEPYTDRNDPTRMKTSGRLYSNGQRVAKAYFGWYIDFESQEKAAEAARLHAGAAQVEKKEKVTARYPTIDKVIMKSRIADEGWTLETQRQREDEKTLAGEHGQRVVKSHGKKRSKTSSKAEEKSRDRLEDAESRAGREDLLSDGWSSDTSTASEGDDDAEFPEAWFSKTGRTVSIREKD